MHTFVRLRGLLGNLRRSSRLPDVCMFRRTPLDEQVHYWPGWFKSSRRNQEIFLFQQLRGTPQPSELHIVAETQGVVFRESCLGPPASIP
jgi:hypothetical protein